MYDVYRISRLFCHIFLSVGQIRIYYFYQCVFMVFTHFAAFPDPRLLPSAGKSNIVAAILKNAFYSLWHMSRTLDTEKCDQCLRISFILEGCKLQTSKCSQVARVKWRARLIFHTQLNSSLWRAVGKTEWGRGRRDSFCLENCAFTSKGTKVQRLTKRLVRGCENFLPALA